MEALRLNTVVLHDNASATNDLARVTFTINFAETSPSTKDLSISDLDQVDFVLGTEGLDEFDVFSLGASLDENAKMGLAFVKGLGTLAEAASETVVDEGIFQDLLK
jgi:hypothetical protein